MKTQFEEQTKNFPSFHRNVFDLNVYDVLQNKLFRIFHKTKKNTFFPNYASSKLESSFGLR